MSIFSKIFRSAKTENQAPIRPKNFRSLRLEPLEDRALLSVSTAEFDAIRQQYPDLELSANIGSYNVIEITSDQLNDAKLRSAIQTAAGFIVNTAT
ncbi:MAG: hypothetical protein LBT05_13245 [Planctomycetaceae bacterium]|jgi:hypothetical protein|nr:hypothetical protein [Planctomycetaceae bacterium]